MKKNFATLESLECIREAKNKINRFYTYIVSTRLSRILWRCYNYYYTAGVTAAGVNRTGDHAEYSRIMVSDFRNLLQHQLLLATNNRPAWDCKAINNDYK